MTTLSAGSLKGALDLGRVGALTIVCLRIADCDKEVADFFVATANVGAETLRGIADDDTTEDDFFANITFTACVLAPDKSD